MKIAIVGSREYPNMEEVRSYVASLPKQDVTIVSGGARGVDYNAEVAARTFGLPLEIYPANWTRFGKSAGFLRNRAIVQAADVVVAFWDGVSNGTRHSVNLAMEARKPLIVFTSFKVNAPDDYMTQARFYNWPNVVGLDQ